MEDELEDELEENHAGWELATLVEEVIESTDLTEEVAIALLFENDLQSTEVISKWQQKKDNKAEWAKIFTR